MKKYVARAFDNVLCLGVTCKNSDDMVEHEVRQRVNVNYYLLRYKKKLLVITHTN